METLLQDIRYGVRVLLKGRTVTFIAIMALALGIGANSAIFSVINGVLLRALPYAEADRIVRLSATSPQRGINDGPFSYPRFEDMQQQPSQSLEAIAAFCGDSFNLTGSDEPEEIQGVRISAASFQVLGVPPLLGRAFRAEEDQRGAANVVLLSHRLWQRRFGGDPGIVGQALMLNGLSYTVIGVMPAAFRFPFDEAEMWTPKVFDYSRLTAEQVRLGAGYLNAVARLKPGASLEQARAEMNAFSQHYQQQNPTLTDSDPNANMRVVLLQDQVVQDIRPALLVLFAAVGFVLLIACANVANLLLARAAARQKEIAIRTALGARRGRIVRQLLTESIMLSVTGGALGLLLANWGVKLLLAASADIIPRTREISMDSRVLGFSLLISVMTGLIFGLAPTLKASKPDLHEALKEGSRGSTEGIRRNRLRSLLVIAEVALSLVLLIGAGLLMQSFVRLQHVNLGFNPQRLLTLRIQLPQSKYAENHQKSAFFDEVIRRVEQLPGVEAVGATLGLPPNGYVRAPFLVEGGEALPPGERPITSWDVINEEYFKAMQIPLLQGRLFNAHDIADSQGVVIINQTLAQRYFPGDDPVGKHLTVGRVPQPFEIVGVVGNVQNTGLDAAPGPHAYTPYRQRPWSAISLVVRTTSEPLALTGEVRAQVLSVDKDQPITAVQTMEQILADNVSQPRLTMLLLGIFAAVAMTLAGVGIYGVMSYSITQRTHEIGIRMALGASRGDVLKLVVGQGMALALAGIGIGLAAAFALTRLMAGLLFGVGATDPLTFAATALILTGVALVACFVPARRATQVDPMVALRYE
jgi:putative ABC transport system permease protein